MGYLTRADILAAKDFEVVAVDVKEWGGSGQVGIRTFDAATRALLLKPAKDGKMPDDWMEQVVAASACDETGALIFTAQDLGELSKKSAVVLERLFTASIELNGLSDSSKEKILGESTPTPK